jgi:hypothetical protein
MTDLDNDPLLQRAIGELRRLPAVDPAVIRDVVAAAASARSGSGDATEANGAPRRRHSAALWGVAGVAVAAALVGFMVRGWLPTRSGRGGSPLSPRLQSGALVRPAANAGEAAPLPQQFVLKNTAARRVAVVGDFNTWNPRNAPMTRAANGVWSAVIPLAPGRHVYGFMIDDSLFTLDPHAPKVRDPDLGTSGSVVLVGRP